MREAAHRAHGLLLVEVEAVHHGGDGEGVVRVEEHEHRRLHGLQHQLLRLLAERRLDDDVALHARHALTRARLTSSCRVSERPPGSYTEATRARGWRTRLCIHVMLRCLVEDV